MLSTEEGRHLEIYLEPPLAPVRKPRSRNSIQQQVSKMANLRLLFPWECLVTLILWPKKSFHGGLLAEAERCSPVSAAKAAATAASSSPWGGGRLEWALLAPPPPRHTHHQQAERRVRHQLHCHGPWLRFPCTDASAESVCLGPGQLQSIRQHLEQSSRTHRLREPRAQGEARPHFPWSGEEGGGGGVRNCAYEEQKIYMEQKAHSKLQVI